MASIEIRGVRKAFASGAAVLDDVSFSLRDGEFVSLLGASGCGKTTLLRIIAGLESADSGAVMIDGKDVTPLSPKDRDIAMVFQNYALYPHLSVSDNIAMGLRLRNFPAARIAERVAEAAHRLGLADLLGRRPAALSGGQRQRVALARALVRHPKVFLLDEPLSNLDAVLREKTRGELKLLFKRIRGTVVYVTHDQVEAMTLSDRVVVLERGRVQQVGPPEEIYHRPANTFVASFLGSPPMNLLPRERASALGLAAAGGGQNELCGIRPEDVTVSLQAREGLVEAEVMLTETTGAVTIVSFDLGVPVRASVPYVAGAAPKKAWIGFPPEKTHFFDAVTSRRL